MVEFKVIEKEEINVGVICMIKTYGVSSGLITVMEFHSILGK